MAQKVEELKEQYDSFVEEIREIDDAVSESISSDPSIGATSLSKTANWRLLRLVWTTMSFLQQKLFDLFKVEIEAIAQNSPKMNSTWLASEVKIFQYGDPLLFDSDKRIYYYEIEDEAKQIINRVAVDDQAGLSVVKVAKAGPAKLTDDELAAFTSFVRLIQPTGSNLDVISLDADLIHLPIEVIYDPIIPKNTVQENVESAINSYLESLSFNGTFYTITLQDKIQEVQGVIDVVPGELKGCPATTGDPTTEDPFERKYLPQSGYIDIYENSSLDQVITYTPSANG